MASAVSNSKKESVVKVFLLSATVALMTSACSSGADTEALKNQVAELQSENATLKTEIAILKDSFAKSKISELKQALQPSSQEGAPSSSWATPSGASTSSGAAQSAGPTSSGSAPQSAAATSSGSASPVVFSDLDDTPTKDMVTELAQLNVFDDLGNKFQPNKPITRAEYIEWLFKSYNALEPAAKQIRFAPQLEQQFKDTPPSHPMYKYVQALANAGFSIGYDDGTFKPDKPLTREEMIGIKVGVDVGKSLPPWRSQMDSVWKFSDSKNVDEKFTGFLNQDFYVSGPHGSNIQRAFGKIGVFRPKQSVLRYEAAATLWQMGQFGDTQNTNVAAVTKSHHQL